MIIITAKVDGLDYVLSGGHPEEFAKRKGNIFRTSDRWRHVSDSRKFFLSKDLTGEYLVTVEADDGDALLNKMAAAPSTASEMARVLADVGDIEKRMFLSGLQVDEHGSLKKLI